MTDTVSPSSTTSVPMPLVSRVVGVLTSPRDTYARIAEHPRVLGPLVLVLAITAGLTFAFLTTEVGQEALLDQQFEFFERLEQRGVRMPPEAYDRIEQQAVWSPYFTAAGQLVTGLIAGPALAGILLVVFNFGLGGNASYKQVLTVVVHSWFVMAVATLFATPLNYVQGSMAGRSNLTVFTPFLDDASFPARLFGLIDLFWIWWIVNLAIGIGVLYKKRTTPVSLSLLVVYGVCVLLIATISYSFF
jgi:hypothetical protein